MLVPLSGLAKSDRLLGNQYLNVPGGANAEYFVIGWTGPYGGPLDGATTFDAARAGPCFFGVSAIYTTATGDPTMTPPSPAVPLRNTFGGLNIPFMPEPSTLTLAGFGALWLMFFRRRGRMD